MKHKGVIILVSSVLLISVVSFFLYKHFRKFSIGGQNTDSMLVEGLDGTAKLIKDELVNLGINNSFLIAGILGVADEESGLEPKRESSYSNTSAARLMQIFPTRLHGMTATEIDLLKKDDNAFFDKIYGGENGNTDEGDGFKYRGGGLNQITFKNEYADYGNRIGVDLLSDPDQITDPAISAKVLAQFFKDGLATAARLGKFTEGSAATVTEGAKQAFQINAGLGTNINNSFLQNRLAIATDNANNYTV